jgi:molecular chaperone DnaK (HSP70)
LGLSTEEPLKAVVAIPASFNQFQRQAAKDAAAIAGLELLQLMPKPTAAAVHYAADQYALASGL